MEVVVEFYFKLKKVLMKIAKKYEQKQLRKICWNWKIWRYLKKVEKFEPAFGAGGGIQGKFEEVLKAFQRHKNLLSGLSGRRFARPWIFFSRFANFKTWINYYKMFKYFIQILSSIFEFNRHLRPTIIILAFMGENAGSKVTCLIGK